MCMSKTFEVLLQFTMNHSEGEEDAHRKLALFRALVLEDNRVSR